MTTATYRHSQTFAKLKGIQESISNNLTSHQYLSVLDHFLYRSVQPLIQGTRFVDVFLAQVLAWQTQNPKRKTSGAGRHSFAANATLFFLCDDYKARLKILRNMRLDRAIIFETIRRWLAIVEQYEQLSTQVATPELLHRLHELGEAASVRSSFSLHAIYTQVKFFYEQASSFKDKILQKYTRMVLNTAKRDYVQLGHKIDIDDIIQVYMMTAAKAIDKCDTERGVLTTHIQNWLMSAKNVVVGQHLQGAMKSLNQAQGNVVDRMTGDSISLDDVPDIPIEESDEHEKEEIIDQVRLVAKTFDPQGVGRILMGIQEVLSYEDRMALRALAVPHTSVDTQLNNLTGNTPKASL
jgi:hypothetical protein